MDTLFLCIPYVYPKLIFKSNNKDFLCFLKKQFYPYIHETLPDMILDEFKEVKFIDMGDNKFHFKYESYFDKIILKRDSMKAIGNFIHSTLFCENNYYFLHGGAISFNEEAIVFLGETGSGKTTLVTYLINHGYKYITDDRIIIDMSNMTIIPYPKPLHLRQKSIGLLCNKYKINLKLTYHKYLKHIRWLYTSSNICENRCKILSILLLNRVPNVKASLHELNYKDGVKYILNNSFSIAKMFENTLNAKKVADNIRIYILEYDDLNEVKNILQIFYNN